jgi:hypothetical protein
MWSISWDMWFISWDMLQKREKKDDLGGYLEKNRKI